MPAAFLCELATGQRGNGATGQRGNYTHFLNNRVNHLTAYIQSNLIFLISFIKTPDSRVCDDTGFLYTAF